jgi:hypothetical protein
MAADLHQLMEPQSEKTIEAKLENNANLSFGPRQLERKTEKVNSFSRANEIHLSPYKFYKPDTANIHVSSKVPKTPIVQINNDSIFSSFDKYSQSRPEFMGAYRTKTT